MVRRVMRILFVLLFFAAGSGLGYYYLQADTIIAGVALNSPVTRYSAIGLVAVIFGFLGVVLAPGIVEQLIRMTSWLEQKLNRMSIQEIIGGATGLILGLIIATLLGSAISWLGVIGGILQTVITIMLGYLGLSVGTKRKEELLSFIPRFGKDKPT
ncbi:MAG TPA: PIN domain nuclease, partial [Desulfobacteria bacterium]|nr:PIN domain nuclease [Desulfobacteria bacterium]